MLYVSPHKYRMVTLKTDSKAKAKVLHAGLVEKEKAKRLKAHLAKIMGTEPVPVVEPAANATPTAPKVSLNEVWTHYLSVVPAPSPFQCKVFKMFETWCKAKGLADANALTPALVLGYLSKHEGKTFNTYKSGLSVIFKKVAIFDIENPFERIPNRTAESEHYRALTNNEVAKLLQKADTFWKPAILLGLYTGLRKTDIAHLKWESIKGETITVVPGKTLRFGRGVHIHMHPALRELFASLKRGKDEDYVWPEMARRHGTGAFEESFRKLMDSAEIKDSKDGHASFHSLRATFITRCEEHGIPRQVLQGIVGHKSPMMTELYSQDKESGKVLRTLPTFSESPETEKHD